MCRYISFLRVFVLSLVLLRRLLVVMCKVTVRLDWSPLMFDSNHLIAQPHGASTIKQ
jgi:hypothetical protein